MTQKIFRFLKGYSVDPIQIDRLLVSTYIQINDIQVNNNDLLKQYLISSNSEEEFQTLTKFKDIVLVEKSKITIEDLIELFEFVISPAEKDVNGAVYTPQYIRNYIIERVLAEIKDTDLSSIKVADISCGCGGFFYTLAVSLKDRLDISFDEIYRDNIFGVDIEQYSINRTKLLLTLLAVTCGEDIPEFKFNLYVGNSLEFDWRNIDVIKENNGFDAIIGNPPYVSASKIDQRSKILLERWSVSKTGKPDLYIPFFQIGIENLRPDGVLGYITVNNFYRSLNGRGIRNYLSEKNHSISIIDFDSEQIFRGRSTYTCICVIKRDNNGVVDYIKSKSQCIISISKKNFLRFRYSDLSNHNGWLLQDKKISNNIKQIESVGKSLGECFEIRNGFATLKNDVFIFTPIDEDTKRYLFEKNEKCYWIEKEICRDAIKPNTLKTEGEIISKKEQLIFPYQSEKNLFGSAGNIVHLIEEKQMVRNFPLAYKYLEDYQSILKQRDKGCREYEVWYAFGRNQAINIYGFKLLFPYISDKPYFVYSEQKDLLFYNGYALVSENEEELLIAQKVLSSKVFWYYIKNTSKPYGSNYYALAKNYVKNFGMYQFDDKQKKLFLKITDKEEVDEFLIKLYNIDI